MQLGAPQWQVPFAPFTEWLQARERAATLRQRAARQCHSYRLRLLFNYWRFYLARNAALRRAWGAAVAHQELLLKWSVFVALKAALRIARRERELRRQVLRHWHSTMRETVQSRQLNLSQLLVRALRRVCAVWNRAVRGVTGRTPQPAWRYPSAARVAFAQVDQRRVKREVFHRLRENARASAAATTAGVLRLWQRQPLALLAVAAWSGAGHQTAKILAWRAWAGYARRRLRFKALVGWRAALPEEANARAVFAGWRAAAALQRAADARARTTPRSGGSTPRTRLGEPRPSVAGSTDDAPEALAVPWLFAAPLPPLWREPLAKAAVMEAVVEGARMHESALRRKMLAVLQVRVRTSGMQPAALLTATTGISRDACRAVPCPHRLRHDCVRAWCGAES